MTGKWIASICRIETIPTLCSEFLLIPPFGRPLSIHPLALDFSWTHVLSSLLSGPFSPAFFSVSQTVSVPLAETSLRQTWLDISFGLLCWSLGFPFFHYLCMASMNFCRPDFEFFILTSKSMQTLTFSLNFRSFWYSYMSILRASKWRKVQTLMLPIGL